MDCEHNKDELLIDYLYGELDPAQRAAFEAHLAGCPACRGQVEELRSVLQLVRAETEEEPPAAVSDRILHLARTAVEHGRAQQAAARRGFWHWLIHPVAVSAILAVAVVSVGLVSFLSSQEAGPGSAAQPAAEQKIEAVRVADELPAAQPAPDLSAAVKKEKKKLEEEEKGLVVADAPAADTADGLAMKDAEDLALRSTANKARAVPEEPTRPVADGADRQAAGGSAAWEPSGPAKALPARGRARHRRAKRSPAHRAPAAAPGEILGGARGDEGAATGALATGDQRAADERNTRRGDVGGSGLAAAKTKARGVGAGDTVDALGSPGQRGQASGGMQARFAQPPPASAGLLEKATDKKAGRNRAPTDDAMAPPAAAPAKPAPKPAAMQAQGKGARAAGEDRPVEREALVADADLDQAAPAPRPEASKADLARPAADEVAIQSASPDGSTAQRREARPADLLSRADGAFARKDYATAAELIRRFLASHPDSARAPGARYRLARALFLGGQCTEALAAAEGALRTAPRDPRAADTLFDLASCQIRLGRFDRASATYLRIERRFPARAAEARRERGRIEVPAVQAAPASER